MIFFSLFLRPFRKFVVSHFMQWFFCDIKKLFGTKNFLRKKEINRTTFSFFFRLLFVKDLKSIFKLSFVAICTRLNIVHGVGG